MHDYRSIWDRKPVLRLVYNDFYDRIIAACVPGITVEIGGGIGNLKQRLPNLVATDIQFSPWLDLVADAQKLPLAPDVVSNIVMVDVLHHVEFPVIFFREAERILRAGGRIVMVEPAITFGSTLFYRLLHHEPVITSADPLVVGAPDPGRDPNDSNQAIPTLIATSHHARFHALFPGLRIERIDWFSLVVYPMSGGFKTWSLLPTTLARLMLRLERAVERFAGRFIAFRMLMVMEKYVGEDSTHPLGSDLRQYD